LNDQLKAKSRVLVIDDEKFIADSLAMILEGEGYDALAVYDGKEAVERTESFTPDCVISDVILPGMNGIEICSLIQERYPDCRILLFSGQAATGELVEKARAEGHTWELLAKPVDPEELLARVALLAK
jgi:CheY-like chemotaxis protein